MVKKKLGGQHEPKPIGELKASLDKALSQDSVSQEALDAFKEKFLNLDLKVVQQKKKEERIGIYERLIALKTKNAELNLSFTDFEKEVLMGLGITQFPPEKKVKKQTYHTKKPKLLIDMERALAKEVLVQGDLDQFKLRLFVISEEKQSKFGGAIYKLLIALKDKHGLELNFSEEENDALKTHDILEDELTGSKRDLPLRSETFQDVFNELCGSAKLIEEACEKLSVYAVGSHHQALTEISNALKYMIDDLNPEKNLAESEIKVNLIKYENLSKQFDGLKFEGMGGLAEDKGAYAMYCKIAKPLVNFIRGLLNLATSAVHYLLGVKDNDNPLAKKIMDRPYFFQTPVSTEEEKVISKQLETLKLLSNQVHEALDKAVPRDTPAV
ncbi:MAG: hypothetical protein P1U61_04865 [Legionellaceae bacterium]|nr:hypothetical protein [Legionellaceae bacterium]